MAHTADITSTTVYSEGRVVIIAGATARTGEAVIRRFLESGFRVAAVGRHIERVQEVLMRLATTAENTGHHGNGGSEGLLALEADLTRDGQAERAVEETLARFGRVDAMTTLVGTGIQQKPFAETHLDDLRRLIEGNLYTTYSLCQAVLPPMLAQGEGYIATVAGGSAFDPAYGRALFGASKAAIVTLTKGIARDHKAQGIRANCLVAGTIATEQARSYLNEEDLRAAATLQEFADALVYLCSLGASGISGAAIELNGREVD